jgi:60 kDa SS-A/Ro ribonucleoprotein
MNHNDPSFSVNWNNLKKLDYMEPIAGYECLKTCTNPGQVTHAIERFPSITHEMVPNQYKNDRDVWMALLKNMPLGALVRQLPKLSSVGIFDPFKPLERVEKAALELLQTKPALAKAHINPLKLIEAFKVYSSEGEIGKSNLTWRVDTRVGEALNKAFYESFDAVEPAGKNTMVCVDVSGSMTSPAAGSYLTCAEASAVLAMAIAKSEPNYAILGFCHELKNLNIGPETSLEAALRNVTNQAFGATDCSLPMLSAIEKKVDIIDTFIVITDNETWYGDVHPYKALQKYRAYSGRDSKLIVVAMTASRRSIADPHDGGMLDVEGFTPDLLRVIAEFSGA